MPKYLLTNLICKICEHECKTTESFTKHLKKHDYTNLQYTIEYLLNNEIPKCECGCGKEVKVYPYRVNTHCLGHTGGGHWQVMYDKDSEEYKTIVSKISKSVIEHYEENTIVRTPEQCERYSESKKKWNFENPEKIAEQIKKMTETKRRQSEEGILSERHWTKVKSGDEVQEITQRMGENISATKKKLFAEGLLHSWNKGLSAKTDIRIAMRSGENHYRYNPDKDRPYTELFRSSIYREFLYELQEGLCFSCGNDPSVKPFCLHHIDENKWNDSFENLIFVCRSCHAKIHNNQNFQDNFDILVTEFKQNKNNQQKFEMFKQQYLLTT